MEKRLRVMRFKTFFLAALMFAMSFFCVSSVCADSRIEGLGGGSSATYRTYYIYSGQKTYVGYYGSGTFACGGTFSYGVEVWHPGTGAFMLLSDLCAPAVPRSIFTCSGKPCARVRIVAISEGLMPCVGLCSSSNDFSVFYTDHGVYAALEWCTGQQTVYPYELIWGNPDYHDYDCDGYESVSTGGDDCGDCSKSVHPGAVEICDNGIDEDCVDGDLPCFAPWGETHNMGSGGSLISGGSRKGNKYSGRGGYERRD